MAYHPRSLNASGISGLIMTVLDDKTDKDRPPKSDSRAPLIATTGCREPSNLSACLEELRRKKKLNEKAVF